MAIDKKFTDNGRFRRRRHRHHLCARRTVVLKEFKIKLPSFSNRDLRRSCSANRVNSFLFLG